MKTESIFKVRPSTDCRVEDRVVLIPPVPPSEGGGLHQIRCTRYRTGHRNHTAFANEAALFFTLQGEGLVRFGANSGVLNPGTIFLRSPFGPIEFETVRHSWHFIKLLFLTELLEQAAGLPQLPAIIRLGNPAQVQALLNQMIETATLPSPRAFEICNDLLRVVLKAIAFGREQDLAVSSPAYQTFLKCKQHVDVNYASVVSLREVAEACHVSETHLWRLFTRFHGTPPASYLRQLKVAHAISLLQSTPLPVQEIAASLAYDDPPAFTRSFRLVTGRPPSAYRRKGLRSVTD